MTNLTLKNDSNAWRFGFCGACAFADGTEPMFGELKLSSPLHMFGDEITLILDADERTGLPTLTGNMMSEDGFAAAFRKELPQHWTAARAKAWAERHLDPVMDRFDLYALGFRFEEY
jgi:hypothetical protein